MSKTILDTNVVSYLMKGGPLAEAHAPHVAGKLLAIAFITVGEMYFGAENNNWGAKRRKALETALRNFVVIPYDNEIARCYGRLMAERKRRVPMTPGLRLVPPAMLSLSLPTMQKISKESRHFRSLRKNRPLIDHDHGRFLVTGKRNPRIWGI